MPSMRFVPWFVRAYIDSFVKLFTNPTSIYLAVLVATQFVLSLLAAVFIPLLVRQLVLPSSIQHDIPLNLVFSPCDADLHGICSYPAATVDLEKHHVLSPSVTYSISVRLEFAPVDVNTKLGLFQNQITVFGEKDVKLKQWHKSTYIKEPSIFVKFLWFTFFPLYLLGFFHDHNVLEILFTDEYLVSPIQEPIRLVYVLQDRFAQVDSAILLVNARFGLIRYLLYYWPVVTYFMMFVTILSGSIALLMFYWGHRSYLFYSNAESSETEKEAVKVMGKIAPEVPNKKEQETLKKSEPPADEFIPPNVDETPECVTKLDGVPGWNTSVLDKSSTVDYGIRKRK